MKFRDLVANEIDVRVGQVGDGYCTLLLYKDARVDMDILDETVGSERWQRKHYELKGNMYCSVGIYFGQVGWVWKDDCGTESYTEKEKGESSDSFKRACVNWGIGRELYTAPAIKVNCKTKDKKISDLTSFVVEGIVIENKAITGLSIKAYNKENRTNEIVFSWGKCKKMTNEPKTAPPSHETPKVEKVDEIERITIMTVAEAYNFEFDLNGKTYRVGACDNKQLFWLRDNAKDKLLEAVEIVLMDKAHTGDVT